MQLIKQATSIISQSPQSRNPSHLRFSSLDFSHMQRHEVICTLADPAFYRVSHASSSARCLSLSLLALRYGF